MRIKDLLYTFGFTLVLLYYGNNLQAQQETFDIANFNRPADSTVFKWSKAQEGNILSYTTVNTKDNSWCRINIVKSTASKGSIEKDFSSEWQDLIVKNFKPSGTPQYDPVQTSGDWKIRSGATAFPYNGSNAMALLTTYSGNDRRMSIVATTNDVSFIHPIDVFIASITLTKPTTVTDPASGTSGNNDIYGTWVISSSDQSSFRVKNGVMSTIWRQYTLNTNGTYTFVSKLFDPLMDNMLLGKESGTYALNGSTISINPQSSVLESWSKKNGSDWNRKLSSRKITLEKAGYQFARQYNSIFNEWQLVLKASKPTKRDGPFSSNAEGWIYIAATDITQIKLPIQ
jgi:hypothetical protein